MLPGTLNYINHSGEYRERSVDVISHVMILIWANLSCSQKATCKVQQILHQHGNLMLLWLTESQHPMKRVEPRSARLQLFRLLQPQVTLRSLPLSSLLQPQLPSIQAKLDTSDQDLIVWTSSSVVYMRCSSQRRIQVSWNGEKDFLSFIPPMYLHKRSFPSISIPRTSRPFVDSWTTMALCMFDPSPLLDLQPRLCGWINI